MASICYSEGVSESEAQKQIKSAEKASIENTLIENRPAEKTRSDNVGVAEAFNSLINWLAEKLEHLEKKYIKKTDETIVESLKDSDLAKETENTEPRAEPEVLPSKPLNLTIPEMAVEGTMEMDSGIKVTLPNLFAEQEKAYVKEKPSASFGGRILLDDAELEGLQEYRLKDVSDAVLGAEVSLEFKTN